MDIPENFTPGDVWWLSYNGGDPIVGRLAERKPLDGGVWMLTDGGFISANSRNLAVLERIPTQAEITRQRAVIETLTAALVDARGATQAFLDMVRVMQRVGAVPIPAILETAEHNCPIILESTDAALSTAREETT